MPRKNYDKMYQIDDAKTESKIEEEVKPVNKNKTTKVEELVVEEKNKTTGKVVGGASLNVRFTPNGSVETTIAEGVEVIIEEDLGDWYKISYPAIGYVMKKFIEV